MTRQEKRANWWHYHWHVVLICLAVAVLFGSFLYETFSKEEPDHCVFYVGTYLLPDETVRAINSRLTELAEDVNGDGEVVVQINSYAINDSDPTAYATQVSLASDLSVLPDQIFLLEDPADFQDKYGLLTMMDGSVYEQGMNPADCEAYAWEACPVLQDTEIGIPLYLARRETAGQAPAQDSFWIALTCGAWKE